jgi:hypothetical protein
VFKTVAEQCDFGLNNTNTVCSLNGKAGCGYCNTSCQMNRVLADGAVVYQTIKGNEAPNSDYYSPYWFILHQVVSE